MTPSTVIAGAALAGLALLASATSPSHSADRDRGGAPDEFQTIVRAALTPGAGSLQTWCHLINVSRSRPIVLGEVNVIDGSAMPVATHTGLIGTVLPPLGKIVLPVDSNTFPGLSSQSSMSVVVSWTGRPGTFRLNADIRVEFVAEGFINAQGYDVVP